MLSWGLYGEDGVYTKSSQLINTFGGWWESFVTMSLCLRELYGNLQVLLYKVREAVSEYEI